jgi:hypothetical protein
LILDARLYRFTDSFFDDVTLRKIQGMQPNGAGFR